MESPVKKINFSVADKENLPLDAQVEALATEMDAQKKVVEEVKQESKPTAAPATKEEEIEPLLQENPQRFVLFPIKYHEVSSRDRVSPTRLRRVKGFFLSFFFFLFFYQLGPC
jgi:ribonucleoside-diphosphate reductase subunit M2